MEKSPSLAEVIASLPDEERVILTLHYLRALSSSQISDLLKVPERSVIAVIAAGKARLTSRLDI
jgi:DNA-directed RNA polymerase specialized sigma24 family protein